MKSIPIKPVFCLLWLCAASGFAGAEETLASMQQSFSQDCTALGRQIGASEEWTRVTCGCMWQSMQDNLNRKEIQQVITQKPDEEPTPAQSAALRKVRQPWESCRSLVSHIPRTPLDPIPAQPGEQP